MANVNSLSSNSYTSGTNLYGSRNVITGLASGLDTESMIQNSVSGYQTKITQLQQQVEKLEWKQDAFRELTDQMYNITQKYTSYSSKTNLASNSFFTNNVTTTTNGTNADKVSATGKATSDIQINAVTKLATTARYSVNASALNFNGRQTATGDAIDWDGSVTEGKLAGTMTLKIGSNTVDLKFTGSDQYTTMQDLVNGINSKLADISATSRKDGSVKASDLVTASLQSDGSIKFDSHSSDGDSVYISGASGNLKSLLNVQTATSSADENRFDYTSFSLKGDVSDLTKTMTMAQYLSGKAIDVTLDGVTKSIKVSDLTSGDTDTLVADIQAGIDRAFGTGRVTVLNENGGLDFQVDPNSGSTLKIASSEAGEKLGIGKNGVTNYFNTSSTLGDLLNSTERDSFRVKGDVNTIDAVNAKYFDKDGNALRKDTDGRFYRANSDGSFMLKDGNKVAGTLKTTAYADGDGNLYMKRYDDTDYYRVNEKGEFLYDFKLNGVSVGQFTDSTAMESVMNKINSSSDAGVNVGYSKLTSQFVFTARETGSGGQISFDSPLAQRLFETSPSSMNDVFGTDWNDLKLELGNGGTITLLSQGQNGNTDIGSMIGGFLGFPDSTKVSAVASDGSAKSFTLGELQAFTNGARLSAANSAGYTAGGDAVIEATVNGRDLTMRRSSNVVSMDGLNVTLKGIFDARDAETGAVSKDDAVTFTTKSNADDIVDTIKTFVEDVNKLMTDVRGAFATQPLKRTSATSSSRTTFYEPLTEEDKADMSESAIKAYEEKAKTGLLFGDTDLSQLYNRLVSAITASGSDMVDMKEIGLTTAYSNGVTTLSLNESKLREALDSDPDKVRSVFTKSKEYGSATNGLMERLKQPLNAYGSTSAGSPGVLVRKAGSKLGGGLSLLNNNIQTQIDGVNKQIESWQSRLSDRIDYYTRQFTALETLMNNMNQQSAALSQLMGGY